MSEVRPLRSALAGFLAFQLLFWAAVVERVQRLRRIL